MRRLAFPTILVLLALVMRLVRADDPRRLDLTHELATPSLGHPLGCGEGGVDLLSLATEALLRSLLLAAAVACVALVVGTLLGAAAGLAGGTAANLTRRLCDGVQAFPSFILALGVLATIRAPSRWHVGVVLALTAWAPFARLALAELRVVRGLTYVEAARALGGGPLRVLFLHAIPATFPVARAQLGSSAAALLVSDAALAFLGVGPSDGVALGSIVDQGLGVIVRAPHVLFVGAVTLAIGALALQALADPSRD